MYLPKTLEAIHNIQQSIKCVSCNTTAPFEPHFTGVCDHLLCKKCISKNYNCPLCSAAFYQKDTYQSKMLKETFSYMNGILELMFEDVTIDEKQTRQNLDLSNRSDESFPDIDLTFGPGEAKPIKTKATSRKVTSDTFKSPALVNTDDTTFKKPPLIPAMPEPAVEAKTKATKTTRRSSMSQKPAPATSKAKPIAESQKPRTQARGARKNDKGETKLHLAVMSNDIEAVKELLRDENMNVNVKDFAGWTALHEACVSGNVEMANTLIEFGADVNSLGFQNNTPLHEATLNNQIECIRILFENGASTKIRNTFGVLPIELAKNKDALKLYVDYEEKMSAGRSPFDDADGEENISRSQFDTSQSLDVSIGRASSSRRSSGAKQSKKVLLYPTGMSEDEKSKFTALASKLNIKVSKEMSQTVTHVVFPGANVCTRTLSYMKGVLMGIWIVSQKWLEDSCEKGYLVEENNYEATGSTKLPDANGPKKGRLNASCQYSKLFEDCNFFLLGNFKAFEKQEFTSLIQLGGGKILKREPKLERIDELMSAELPDHLEKDFKCTHFILHELTKLKEEIRHPYLNSVLPGWLFNCIDEFKILKPV